MNNSQKYVTITEAHTPIAEAFRSAGALPEAFDEVAHIILNNIRVVDGQAHFIERDGSTALDPHNEWREFDPASFVAHVRRVRPHLFDQQKKSATDLETKARDDATLSQKNFTELMVAARSGDVDAMRELTKRTSN